VGYSMCRAMQRSQATWIWACVVSTPAGETRGCANGNPAVFDRLTDPGW